MYDKIHYVFNNCYLHWIWHKHCSAMQNTTPSLPPPPLSSYGAFASPSYTVTHISTSRSGNFFRHPSSKHTVTQLVPPVRPSVFVSVLFPSYALFSPRVPTSLLTCLSTTTFFPYYSPHFHISYISYILIVIVKAALRVQ